MAKELFCTNCGYQGWPKSNTKRPFGIELILWLFLIIPNLIRSVGQRTYGRCPICDSRNMVLLTSPRAKHLLSASRESLSTAADSPPRDTG